jgi:hypothetical protein
MNNYYQQETFETLIAKLIHQNPINNEDNKIKCIENEDNKRKYNEIEDNINYSNKRKYSEIEDDEIECNANKRKYSEIENNINYSNKRKYSEIESYKILYDKCDKCNYRHKKNCCWVEHPYASPIWYFIKNIAKIDYGILKNIQYCVNKELSNRNM